MGDKNWSDKITELNSLSQIVGIEPTTFDFSINALTDVVIFGIRPKVQSYGFNLNSELLILAETAGLEPARVWLDCLANSYGYRFITFPNKKFGASNRIWTDD